MTDLARWIQEILAQEKHSLGCENNELWDAHHGVYGKCTCDQPERAAERLATIARASLNGCAKRLWPSERAEIFEAALAVFERAAKGDDNV